MKRHINLKKGETLEVHFEELDQFEPRYREMVVRLYVQDDKTIKVNTVYMKSTIHHAYDSFGVVLKAIFH